MYNSRFIVIAIVAIILESCKTTPPAVTTTPDPVPAQEPVLITLGDKSYTTRDFSASFEKNKYSLNAEKPLSPQEYLELFTNMKLKVLAAQKEGGDTTENFRDEISSYREILSQNFLNDKDLVEQFAREAYERSKTEVHASHILIRVSELASPADTLKAYETARKIWTQLRDGADFGELAQKSSQDPSAKSNKGDLGSFTVFQMVYPFETAAYHTPVGQFSEPFRSIHGYHIIKVHDRRPNRGKIQVAHCMVPSSEKDASEQRKAAKNKIDQAYNLLKSGESWDSVVKNFSEDQRSVQNQGLLPAFGIGTMVKPFEDAAFVLNKPGDYSEPVQTPYGWHIIKLVKKIPAESYEEAAPALRQKVTQDSRGKLIDKINQQKTRARYPVTENLDVLQRIGTLADSTLLKARWTIPAPVPQEISDAHLFVLSRKAYTGGEFLGFLKNKQRPLPPGSSVDVALRRYYNDFVNEKLALHAKSQLEKDQPEFQQLMQEITDGVLLSNMMEKYVWGKSLTDSLGQRQIFESNRNKYQYPERALATLAVTQDTALLSRCRRMLSGYPYSLELKGEDLFFEDNETTLNDEAIRKLRRIVTAMGANPQYIVEINAHRHEKESGGVSDSRLNNVVSFLKDNEVSLNRIVEKNHDALKNTSDAATNRKVTFIYYSTSAQDVARVLNNNLPGGEEVTVRDGYITKDDPLLSGLEWKTGEQLRATSGDKKWIYIKETQAPRLKTFEEARGAVINDYQRVLEQQWLEKLKKEYPATVNKNELSKVK